MRSPSGLSMGWGHERCNTGRLAGRLTAGEGANPQTKLVASVWALLEQNRHSHPLVCAYGWRALFPSIDGCGDFVHIFVWVALVGRIGTLLDLSAGVAEEGPFRWSRVLP